MFERFTRHAIEMIVLCFIVLMIAIGIWNAIPGIIKIAAVVVVVVGFVSILKGK